MKIEDIIGKLFFLWIVFKEVISFFKKYVLEVIMRKIMVIFLDVFWVLIIFVIWSEFVK